MFFNVDDLDDKTKKTGFVLPSVLIAQQPPSRIVDSAAELWVRCPITTGESKFEKLFNLVGLLVPKYLIKKHGIEVAKHLENAFASGSLNVTLVTNTAFTCGNLHRSLQCRNSSG